LNNRAKGEHRTRVGAERRARMRRKLVEAALIVFAEKGVDASIIDDVIAAAGVSRGTFYNYFRSNTELLIATSEELANEIVDLIEGSLDTTAPSLVSLATGLRLFLDVVGQFPLLGRFITRIGFQAESQTALIFVYPAKHIAEAIRRGELIGVDTATALDVVIGCTLVIVARLSAGSAAPSYITSMLTMIMRALGVQLDRAAEIVTGPSTSLRLGPETLLARSHAHLAKLLGEQPERCGQVPKSHSDLPEAKDSRATIRTLAGSNMASTPITIPTRRRRSRIDSATRKSVPHRGT